MPPTNQRDNEMANVKKVIPGTLTETVALIEAAGGHARALTKLAGEIGRRRLRATIVDYRQLMTELEARQGAEPERRARPHFGGGTH